MTPVTDPAILRALEAAEEPGKPVTDPAVLHQLEGSPRRLPSLRAAGTKLREDLGDTSMAEGVVRGMMDVPDAGAQLVTRGLEAVAPSGSGFEAWAKGERENVERINQERESAYQQRRGARGESGFDARRMVGNVAATAPLSIAAPVAATGGLAARTAAGGALGGASGALTPVDPEAPNFWKEKLKQAALGAVTGGATSAVLGRTNASSDPNVQALLQENVRLTPGQMSGGTVKRMEDAATSLPIVGDVVRNSQRRGVEDLNRAAINRALAPIGQTLPRDVNVGRDAVTHAQTAVSQAYDNLLPQLRLTVDQPFLRDVSNLHQMAQGMEPQLADRFNRVLQEKVVNRLAPTGTMDGQTMKAMEEDLGKIAANFRMGNSTAAEREFGDAVADLQAYVRDLVTRSNPDHAAELQAINRAFANLTVIDRAAGAQGAVEGIFSPAQLSSAVKAGDRSARDRAFAGGRALMQDLSDPAKAVMPSSVPDSGSPLRIFTGVAGLGGAGMMSPGAAAGGAALGALYTPPGQAIMRALMAHRPDGLLNAVPPAAAASPHLLEIARELMRPAPSNASYGRR